MLAGLFKRLRSRSISLRSKIVALVLATVVASLSLSGWLIYTAMRSRTYEEAALSLEQTANAASSVFDARGLEGVRGPADAGKAAYKKAAAALRAVWKRSHFDRPGHWGRVTVLRFRRSAKALSVVAGLEGGPEIGRPAAFKDELFEALARREAVAEARLHLGQDWMAAYAPLPSALEGEEAYLLGVELNTAPLQWRLFRTMGTIVLGALAGLLLALLGGTLLSHQITSPLRAFVDVMKLMQGSGDYDLKIDLHPEDRDMSVLEDTFVQLIAKMRDSRRKEESSYWSTLQALVTALDVRDNETAGHSLRVTRYCLAIGERMRLGAAQLEQVRQGALLHDIGKIGVPDAILRKASKLDEAEWEEMKKHPAIGRNFLEEIEFLRPATAVVYCHHERFDGSGYPQGLAGDAIPVAARVFAVADALDAITSQRYYKEANSFREAQKEIEAGSGSHFDPAVVKAFLALPERVFNRIRAETSLAGLELERLRRKAA